MATRLRDAGGTLLELDAELRRLTRRADRQQRRMRQSADAWQLWSSTIDDGLDIVGRIDDASALDVDALAIKFRAIFCACVSTRNSSWTRQLPGHCTSSAAARALGSPRGRLFGMDHAFYRA